MFTKRPPPPKPITLGVIESIATLSGGRIPRRECFLCALARLLFVSCLISVIVLGLGYFVGGMV